MNFSFTADQEILSDAVRRFLEAGSPMDRIHLGARCSSLFQASEILPAHAR